LSNGDTVLKEAYSSFKQRVSFDDFQSKLNSLTIDKLNFVRATLLYQQSLKCKECNPNVEMVLLCSCADAIQLKGERNSYNNFKEFYMRYCPSQFKDSQIENLPIEYMYNGKPPMKTAPFEKALYFIYKQFRNMYVHEGIKRLRAEDNIDFLFDKLKDKNGVNDYYKINLPEILNWFEKITFESLFAMLMTNKIDSSRV
jgi:hypothetical protein